MRASIEFAKTILSPNELIVEVGVYRGEHARQMEQELKPLMIYLVDIKKMCEPNFKHIFLEYSSQIASLYVPDNLGLVYIDALHTEFSTCIDIACWYPKIKIGGIICGHDYSPDNGIGKAVKRFFGEVENRETDWWVVKTREGY